MTAFLPCRSLDSITVTCISYNSFNSLIIKIHSITLKYLQLAIQYLYL
uniref:Uncharacterized protein n=1 Tax=Arundo donax TaxID=35708 RepID=A0A0A8ZR80_ARUDO